MSVIFEINRDFPYQVALSFDQIAMEVLAWLDERSFEWDMYVDMPTGAIRYCFRSAADATAFKRRFVHAAQRRIVGARRRARTASGEYPRPRWCRTASASLSAHLPVHSARLRRQRICRGKGHHGNVDRGRNRAQEQPSALGRRAVLRLDRAQSTALAKDFTSIEFRVRLPLRRIRHVARASDRSRFMTFETDTKSCFHYN